MKDTNTLENVLNSIEKEKKGLRSRIAMADGLQITGDKCASDHHFSNVLYNCMRGGTFIDGYNCKKADFMTFMKRNNKSIFKLVESDIKKLPDVFNINKLEELSCIHPQMKRLIHQYLPITFSRRHGDPSRPWNRFDIRVRDSQGEPIYAYQGNWRDIFQNWESLAQSYPIYITNMRNLFLNATTADGYNPYRITSDGIDWESPDPEDPWSNIGYWGDHQIIYLLRLLETEETYFPGKLSSELKDRVHSFAHIPYEIKDYESICANPRNTICFNDDLDNQLHNQFKEIGADGKLLNDEDGNITLTSLGEKLMIPLLTKLSNFIPGGGIWLNTQRPEWNDANNALAGYGLSMVTVCYIRRYLCFLRNSVFNSIDSLHLELHEPTAKLFRNLIKIFEAQDPSEAASISEVRTYVAKSLGQSGEEYRRSVYNNNFGNIIQISSSEVEKFINETLNHIDACILFNKRTDKMLHSYNLLKIKENLYEIKHLDLMLEGQVALLSANVLDGTDVVNLCKQLRKSDLFREDQYSYLLYPDQSVPSFLERNTFEESFLLKSPLLAQLVQTKNTQIINQDINGKLHFNSSLKNAEDLDRALEVTANETGLNDLLEKDKDLILNKWEDIFSHHEFTGRSSRFFAFEGLGSIYWHMISKLLLAVQENIRTEDNECVREDLISCYEDIRLGLGFTKTADVYGAFPTDAYSHSPRHIGAQQPGMTGQVKEEILTRRAELGITINNGQIQFNPEMIQIRDYLAADKSILFFTINNTWKEFKIPKGAFAQTICQTPVIFKQDEKFKILIKNSDDTDKESENNFLSLSDSQSIFRREGKIKQIIVSLPYKTQKENIISKNKKKLEPIH